MKINWQWIARITCAGFLSLLLWACGRIIGQQDKILVKLNDLELEMVKLKASIIDRSDVLEIVKAYLYEQGIKK